MKGFVIFGVFVLLLLGGGCYNFLTAEEVTFRVTDKERVYTSTSEGGTNSKYLVFTETDRGVEVFRNTDTIFYFKYDSSDIQARLKQDSTYNARVYGVRIPFFSMYRNIVDVRPAQVGVE